MESLVVSLNTAKQLKAAGYLHKSINVWEWSAGTPVGEAYLWQPELMRKYGLWGSQDVKERAAAPTAQELADQLPKPEDIDVEQFDSDYDAADGLFLALIEGKCMAQYQIEELVISGLMCEGPTMAEALAALWLKLKELPDERQ